VGSMPLPRPTEAVALAMPVEELGRPSRRGAPAFRAKHGSRPRDQDARAERGAGRAGERDELEHRCLRLLHPDDDATRPARAQAVFAAMVRLALSCLIRRFVVRLLRPPT
jgi:hypothetical protein